MPYVFCSRFVGNLFSCPVNEMVRVRLKLAFKFGLAFVWELHRVGLGEHTGIIL